MQALGITNKFGGLKNSLNDIVQRTFEGAMGSKASLLSFVSTLANFCLFNFVPTSNAIVITPKLNVTRFTDQDIYIDKKKIVSVILPYQPLRIPVEKVCLNYQATNSYHKPDGQTPQDNNLNSDWYDHFRWPPIEGGGAVLVDMPPILANISDASVSAGDSAAQPSALNRGGKPGSTVNSAGLKPYMTPADLDRRVGTIAARLMWSKLAFNNRAINIGLIPHWLFSPDFYSRLGQVYEEGTPWGLLGNTVMMRAPYSLAESQNSDDIPYIGYVNTMALDISVPDARFTAQIGLTNVRTTVEDQWAFAPTDNPLYDNIDAQPV